VGGGVDHRPHADVGAVEQFRDGGVGEDAVAFEVEGAVGTRVQVQGDRAGHGGVGGLTRRRTAGCVGGAFDEAGEGGQAAGFGEQPEGAGAALVQALTVGSVAGCCGGVGAEDAVRASEPGRDLGQALVEQAGGDRVQGAADLGVVVVGVLDEHLPPRTHLLGAPAQQVRCLRG